jgi:hypothetical protein
MNILRIVHRAGDSPDQHSVTVSLKGDGLAHLRFTTAFPFLFTQQERNDIRWYLETYLQYPLDPADKRAARVEALMADLGERFFRAVFEADRDAFKLWARLQADLNTTRVEVAGDHPRAWTLPWELLRDPDTETYLALHAQEFVRVHLGPAREVRLPQTAADEAIRILLVIARPGLEADVPYRSVARRLVAALGDRDTVRLDVLRPPTYAALAQRLRKAKDGGGPRSGPTRCSPSDRSRRPGGRRGWRRTNQDEIYAACSFSSIIARSWREPCVCGCSGPKAFSRMVNARRIRQAASSSLPSS